jgi:thiol:disulfide interchange protein
MEVFKQAISIPIFITVIWLAWVLANAYGTTLLALVLLGFLLLAVAGWFLGRWPAKRWAAVVAGLVVISVVGLDASSAVLFERVEPESHRAPGQASSLNLPAAGLWQPWSADAVQKSLAAGRPVFVDFTASWCLSCQVNERVALDRPEVQQAFANANVVLLRADWTREDPAITQALAALGRSGVPVYALYTPGQANPQLLPQVLTPAIVTGAIAQLPRNETESTAQTSN